MKKKYQVVYNSAYGGYHFSPDAVLWLEENGRQEIKDFLKESRQKYEKEYNENKEPKLRFILFENEKPIEDLMARDLDRLPRHDVDLVKCVKALKDKAGGWYSNLKVATLKGNKYRIDEYDGWESVMEPDDYNFITIEDENVNN